MKLNRRSLMCTGLATAAFPVRSSAIAGTQDDQAELQAKIDAALAGPSRRVVLEPRTYRLTGPLLLRGEHVIGLEVVGQRVGSVLLQTNPAAPIFQVQATGLNHTNSFRGFTATWAHPPAETIATRAAFHFPSTGSTDFFNSSFEAITVLGASWAFRSDGPSFWGNRIVDLMVGGRTNGGVVWLVPDHKTGQPNNEFDKHYIDAHAMRGPLYKGASLCAEMHAIEVNQADQGPIFLWDEGGGQYDIGHFRAEVATFGQPTALFHMPNGQLIASTIELRTLDLRAPVWLIEANLNPVSCFDVRNVYVSNLTNPSRFALVRPIDGAPLRDARFSFGRVRLPTA